MGSTIFLNISGLMYTILIAVCFFSKDRVNSYENKMYGNLIIVTIAELLCGLLSYISLITPFPLLANEVIGKLFLISMISWTTFFLCYIISISYNLDEPKKKKIVKRIIFFFVLFSVFILIFKLDFVKLENGGLFSTGLPVLLCYSLSGIYIFLMLISGWKNLNNKSKKYIPLWVFIILGTIFMIIQIINPELFLVVPAEVFITSIMYHTIENPDIKMLSEVTAAKDAADKANRAKSDFLSSMSHEIRTPLNAIVGFSECIKNADSLEEAKENAADIVTASESLLEIVNGILDISKIESGKLELVQSDYDIYKILDEVVKLIKARLGDKPLNFEVNIAEDIPHVLYGDHFNIKKILINFLTNAVKYTDEGYVKFDVKCVIVNNNVCRLIMSVKDSGRGIKKENIDKLFTKFQRLDEDKNTTIEGT